MDPCYTMTTPDGYTLTPLGLKTLGCIGGGTIATLRVPITQKTNVEHWNIPFPFIPNK